MQTENQTSYVVTKTDGKLDVLMIRNKADRHSHCNADHDNKVGEEIFWHKSDFYMTKVEGTIVAKRNCAWDYSMPLGQRATNLIESDNFMALLKQYRDSLPPQTNH